MSKYASQTTQVKFENISFTNNVFTSLFYALREFDSKNWQLSDDKSFIFNNNYGDTLINSGLSRLIEAKTGVRNFLDGVNIVAQRVEWREDEDGHRYCVKV